GTDPLTRRAIRLKATAKTEQQARIELGRLLKEASEGRTPESAATVAKLLDEYSSIAPWDVSTRQTNEGFIRRTITPALGHLEARKVRGFASGDELPSITELSALQGIGTGVIRKALEALAADGLIVVRHGRATVVAGEPSGDPRLSRRRPGPGHDCRLAGCRPHVCHPMKAST